MHKKLGLQQCKFILKSSVYYNN